MTWQPIETAPKCGDPLEEAAIPLLLFCPVPEKDQEVYGQDYNMVVGWWEPGLNCWYDSNPLTTFPPTHWMPLPSPPSCLP